MKMSCKFGFVGIRRTEKLKQVLSITKNICADCKEYYYFIKMCVWWKMFIQNYVKFTTINIFVNLTVPVREQFKAFNKVVHWKYENMKNIIVDVVHKNWFASCKCCRRTLNVW